MFEIYSDVLKTSVIDNCINLLLILPVIVKKLKFFIY